VPATYQRLNDSSRGWCGFARNSGSQSLGAVTISTGYDLDDTDVSFTWHSNRMVVCLGHVTVTCTGSNAGARVSLQIIEGGTEIGRSGGTCVTTAGGTAVGSNGPATLSGWALQNAPSNISHTYHLQLYVHEIYGTPTLSISGSSPAWAELMVLDMGDAG
jgi:hypothetical protein